MVVPSRVHVLFSHRRRQRRFAGTPRSTSGSKQRTLGFPCRRESQKPDLLQNVVIHRLHPAAHEVGFMLEPRPSGLTKKLPPPLAMGIGTRPALERVEVSPILPHPDMWRQHRPEQRLMKQQPVRLSLHRPGDLGAEAEYRLQSRPVVAPHAEVMTTRSGKPDRSTVLRRIGRGVIASRFGRTDRTDRRGIGRLITYCAARSPRPPDPAGQSRRKTPYRTIR